MVGFHCTVNAFNKSQVILRVICPRGLDREFSLAEKVKYNGVVLAEIENMFSRIPPLKFHIIQCSRD